MTAPFTLHRTGADRVAEEAERINKLPQWARHLMSSLASDLDHWHAEATRGPHNSNTWHGDQPLGNNARVLYQFGDERQIAVQLDGRGALEVMSTGLNASSLAIAPQSSNVARIYPVDY